MDSDGLGALVEAATDGIVIADAEGRIVSWNPAAERTFGYPADEVVGRPLTVIIPHRFQAAHLEVVARVAAGGEHHVIGKTVELTAVRRDGEEFPIELSLASWTNGDEVLYSGILRDISVRKLAERQIEEANTELAEKNAQLEALGEARQVPVPPGLRLDLRGEDRGPGRVVSEAAHRLLLRHRGVLRPHRHDGGGEIQVKGIAHPLLTYEIVGRRAAEESVG